MMTIAAVREALGWKTPDGCQKCRPALNYFLICAWPETYRDDAQSRFVNERVHANIQKDGTFSVVPRMWGGLTNSRELRAIADVAEKYAIPTVKVTGGQRIDLLGVKKQELPAVWGDLNKAGLVSGHAYAKGLRTVKTCVGSEWCRFGTQDSTGLGVKIEQMCWGSWTPHKVKLAVSGCPRNCAEATIKDIGIVCVEAGYDVVVGGNGGIEVRVTDHRVRLATEAEVLEHIGAFMQLYREEARYLERTAPWVARVGIDYMRERVVADAEGRRALHGRFLVSQRMVQTDPWAQRAGGAEAHEYQRPRGSRLTCPQAAGSRSGGSTTSRGAARAACAGPHCRGLRSPSSAPATISSSRSSTAARIAADRSPRASSRAAPLPPARCTGWVIHLDSGEAEDPDEGQRAGHLRQACRQAAFGCSWRDHRGAPGALASEAA